MTQYELNRQVSKQTGESIKEINRRGFTILKELPEDDDHEPLPTRAVARTVGV